MWTQHKTKRFFYINYTLTKGNQPSTHNHKTYCHSICVSMFYFTLLFVCLLFVWLQAEDVRRVADNELGFQQVTLSRPSQAKTYLFINTDRMVVGCLVAENIRQVLCLCVSMFACSLHF